MSTEQWQSFETRMRQRRLERCLARAEAALEAGHEAAARDAIDEAKLLDPGVRGIDAMRATVEERRLAAAAAAAAETAAAEGAVRRRTTTRQAAVAAGLALALFGGSAAIMYRAAAGSRVAMLDDLQRPARGMSALSQPATQPPSTAAPEHPVENAPRESAAVQTATREFTLAPVSVAPSPALPATDTNQSRPDVRVQATDSVVTPLETPRVSSTPFSSAPGDVASIPPPPAPPAVEDRAPAAAAVPVANLPPAAPVPPPVDEAARVRSVLSQYETAYSQLDAGAAQVIWPGVDGRSLARAFQSLERQRVSLGQCALAIDGVTARADCDGSATWTPKIGGGTRTEARHWKFELQNTGGTWQIITAAARTP